MSGIIQYYSSGRGNHRGRRFRVWKNFACLGLIKKLMRIEYKMNGELQGVEIRPHCSFRLYLAKGRKQNRHSVYLSRGAWLKKCIVCPRLSLPRESGYPVAWIKIKGIHPWFMFWAPLGLHALSWVLMRDHWAIWRSLPSWALHSSRGR